GVLDPEREPPRSYRWGPDWRRGHLPRRTAPRPGFRLVPGAETAAGHCRVRRAAGRVRSRRRAPLLARHGAVEAWSHRTSVAGLPPRDRVGAHELRRAPRRRPNPERAAALGRDPRDVGPLYQESAQR